MVERLKSITTADESALIDLLTNAVADGASVGFLAPLRECEAVEYWREVAEDLPEGNRVLLVARIDERIVGTVQLSLVTKVNGIHRAEVQKILVHTSVRRHGVGTALMKAIEAEARRAGRSLLVLDTREGDSASHLYEQIGYTLAGVIPEYAISSSGTRDGSAFYFKRLN